MSWLYNAWVSVMVRQRLADVDGALLIRRAILETLPWRTESLFIQGELCAQAYRKGFRIGQVTIVHRPREGGSSRAVHWASVWSAMQEMARFSATRNRQRNKPR